MKILLVMGSLLSISAFAAKGYQVTGPVIEVTETKIVVQKGKEKWELAKTAATKTTGDVKVGEKVTVYYAMTAEEIEAKAAKPPKKAK